TVGWPGIIGVWCLGFFWFLGFGVSFCYDNDMTNGAIGPQSTMGEVLALYPGAQRALFRRYHIGGCASCGFQPTETLEQVCQRNGIANVGEVLDHVKTSHGQDASILIEAKALAEWLKQDK